MSGLLTNLIVVKELAKGVKMVCKPQNDPGFLTFDAGPDNSRASDFEVFNPDRNDGSYAHQNVAVWVPEQSGTAENLNVAEPQMNKINPSEADR